MQIDNTTQIDNKTLPTRTKEQRAELLKKANILDDNGHYVAHFFSAKTLQKEKTRGDK